MVDRILKYLRDKWRRLIYGPPPFEPAGIMPTFYVDQYQQALESMIRQTGPRLRMFRNDR